MNQPPYNQQNNQPAYMNQPPYNQQNVQQPNVQSGVLGGNVQPALSAGGTQPTYNQTRYDQQPAQGINNSSLFGGGFNPDSPFNFGAPVSPQNNYNPQTYSQPAPLPQSSAPTSFNPNAGIKSSQPAPLPQSSAPTSFNPNAGINNSQPAPLPQSNAPKSFNPNAGIKNNQPAPLPQSSAPTSFNPNAGIKSSQPAPPVAPAAPKLKITRKRAPATGKTIIKGQKIALEQPGEPPVGRIKIALGWECRDSRCELDASAFMLGGGDKVPSDDWFIFYGQPDSPDKSVSYRVFADDPSNCDDAAVEIDLSRVDPRVDKIAVAITIYEAFEKKLNFGMVPSVYARIINCATNKEIIRFELTDRNSAVTALVVGELYRYKGAWKFNAVGSGVNRDLAGFCGMYGVELA
jgi:stress response protein SCP2